MKATVKRMAGNYEIILEGQNDDEDDVLDDMFVSGSITARGETAQSHSQLILSTGIPPR